MKAPVVSRWGHASAGPFFSWGIMGLFGGGNSIFNNPSQLWSGGGTGQTAFNLYTAYDAPLLTGVGNFLNNLINPQANTPSTKAPPAPPNASSIAGASLQETLSQEQNQYNASTLLNGGGGTPMSQSPITASNVLRAGTR